MNQLTDRIIKQLLSKNSLEEVEEDELVQLAEQYPFFSGAQYLLARKANNPPGHRPTLQVHFPNQLWLEQMFIGAGDAIISQPEKDLKEESSFGIKTEQRPVEVLSSAHRMENTEPIIAAAAQQEPGAMSEQPAGDDAHKASQPGLVKEPIPASNTEGLTFEPYHTIDYFASQGIRFKEEERPKDRFGQQLKSFTEWLKTLKKQPLETLASAPSTVAEKKVEELAEKSIVDRDVETEAMAEVWEKQGNPEKAIRIYNKLSLLEPAKSGYFAAKIEGLKKKI